jgi:hypothetical protein
MRYRIINDYISHVAIERYFEDGCSFEFGVYYKDADKERKIDSFICHASAYFIGLEEEPEFPTQNFKLEIDEQTGLKYHVKTSVKRKYFNKTHPSLPTMINSDQSLWIMMKDQGYSKNGVIHRLRSEYWDGNKENEYFRLSIDPNEGNNELEDDDPYFSSVEKKVYTENTKETIENYVSYSAKFDPKNILGEEYAILGDKNGNIIQLKIDERPTFILIKSMFLDVCDDIDYIKTDLTIGPLDKDWLNLQKIKQNFTQGGGWLHD